MELLIYKDKRAEYSYYLDKNDGRIKHGEYKDYHLTGQLWEHCFYYHGVLHGEYKLWSYNGNFLEHCFYINRRHHPYVEMSEQEKLFFQIQHPGFRFIED